MKKNRKRTVTPKPTRISTLQGRPIHCGRQMYIHSRSLMSGKRKVIQYICPVCGTTTIKSGTGE